MTERWDETRAFLDHVDRLGGGPDAAMQSSSAAAGWLEAERLRAFLAKVEALYDARAAAEVLARQATEAKLREVEADRDRWLAKAERHMQARVDAEMAQRKAEARAEQADRDRDDGRRELAVLGSYTMGVLDSDHERWARPWGPKLWAKMTWGCAEAHRLFPDAWDPDQPPQVIEPALEAMTAASDRVWAEATEAAVALGRKHARQWMDQGEPVRATAVTCLVSEIEASAHRKA